MKDLAIGIGLIDWILFGIVACCYMVYRAIDSAQIGDWMQGCYWLLALMMIYQMDSKRKNK